MPRMLARTAPFLWFAVLALALTWPLARHPFSVLGAHSGPGDAYLNLWILGWDLQTLTGAPASLVDGRIFDANIFHPARQTLTFMDLGIVQAILIWPLYALTGSVVFAYNALLILSLFLNAAAMWLLAQRVTGSAWGAVAAGTVWGFWSYPFAHIAPGHLNLLCLYVLPIAWLFLHRLVARGRWRDAAGFGAAVGVLAAASVYYGVIGAIGLGASALMLSITIGGRSASRLLTRGLLSVAIGALFVLPVAIPYWQAAQREGFGRNLFEASRRAASPASYVNAPPVNLLYGRTGWLIGDESPEKQLFAGFATIIVAIAGFAFARRRGSWPLAASALALIALGFVLSLGPDGVRPLYAFFQQWVFGFNAIRAPARIALLVMLGLSLGVALGVREIEQRVRTRFADRPRVAAMLLAVVIGILAAEHFNVAAAWFPAPPASTPIGRWLKDAPGDGAVIVLPLAHDLPSTPHMVESLEHRRPIVNGYSGQRPAFYSALVDTMSRFPSAEAFWTLHDLGVQYISSPAEIDTQGWPVVERARLADAYAGGAPRVIYELRWSDEVEATLTEPEPPLPPEPGPAPFALGEQTTYDVIWDGPAGRVTAGTVVLDVLSIPPDEEPADADGVRFELRATTAPWMTRFFEARDTFSSTADAGLLPRRYEQQLREGARKVDRTVTFDHAGRRVQTSQDGPALRLWRAARDPLTAFFYLRTLALEPGARVQVPINDNGRNLTLDVEVGKPETIRVGGKDVSALRLMPVLRQRVERRRPPEIVVWMSRDDRRVPLAADVTAPFGHVRLELTSHRPGQR